MHKPLPWSPQQRVPCIREPTTLTNRIMASLTHTGHHSKWESGAAAGSPAVTGQSRVPHGQYLSKLTGPEGLPDSLLVSERKILWHMLTSLSALIGALASGQHTQPSQAASHHADPAGDADSRLSQATTRLENDTYSTNTSYLASACSAAPLLHYHKCQSTRPQRCTREVRHV
jgi:hypothetical protein